MKLYKITTIHAETPPKFVGSLSDGIAYRKELMDTKGYRRADIKQEEVDVPSGKAGLIYFLNKVPA